MTHPAAWPGRDAVPLQRVCALVGLDSRGAVELHLRANAAYLLPRANAVVRLRRTGGSEEWEHRLATGVHVTRWLTAQGFPTVVPLDISQPVTVDDWAGTFWRYEHTTSEKKATVIDLAGILRRLHELPVPPIDLPATNPLGSLPADLERHGHVLDLTQRKWLRRRSIEIATSYSHATMPPALDRGLVHGDAHTGNLLPVAGALLLGDWDSVSYGPRAQDLVPTLVRCLRFGYPSSDWHDLCLAYGVDADAIKKHPGIRLLQEARELRSLAAYLRTATQPDIHAELIKRLRTLMSAEDATWLAI